MSVAARSSVSTPSRRPAAGSRSRSRLGFSRTLSSAWASASSTRSISPRSARVRSSHSAARRGSGTSASPSAIWPSRSAIWRVSSPIASLAGCTRSGANSRPAASPGGRADQRLGDAAGGGGVRVDREDQHGADRHLQDLLAQPQHHAEAERARDEQAEHPPAERDVGGHRDGGQHARGDRRLPAGWRCRWCGTRSPAPPAARSAGRAPSGTTRRATAARAGRRKPPSGSAG